jgi:hypothetical protein
MAGTRKSPLWRQAFLRALKRTGNVRAAAFEAGVDPGTAYDHRAKDAGFRAAWAGALKAFGAAERKKALTPTLSPNGRGGKEELVLRRGKDGDRLVRAAPGRWSRRLEESFLDGLEQSGCVRTAAAAAGISTNALYRRRDRYPEFRARWDERVGRFREQLPAMLDAAAVTSLSPEPEGAKRRGRARLPPVSVDQAIRIKVANDNADAKARGPGRRGGISARELRPQRSEAEEHEDLVQQLGKLIGMKKRHLEAQRLSEGWTDCGNGVWLPPGWTATPPPGPPPEEGNGDSQE